VRHLPNGTTTWHPIDDNLAGKVAYGPQPGTHDDAAPWSIAWSNIRFTHFLFAFGHCTKWLVASKEAVGGLYGDDYYFGARRDVLISSINAMPHTLEWVNRGSYRPEDPWISLTDHNDGYQNLYGEDSWINDCSSTGCMSDEGANVYIRASASGRACSLIWMFAKLLCIKNWTKCGSPDKANTQTQTYIHTYTTSTSKHTHTYIYTHVSSHNCMLTNIHQHAHTYIHINT
jgi:hypothetical protein